MSNCFALGEEYQKNWQFWTDNIDKLQLPYVWAVQDCSIVQLKIALLSKIKGYKKQKDGSLKEVSLLRVTSEDIAKGKGGWYTEQTYPVSRTPGWDPLPDKNPWKNFAPEAGDICHWTFLKKYDRKKRKYILIPKKELRVYGHVGSYDGEGIFHMSSSKGAIKEKMNSKMARKVVRIGRLPYGEDIR